MLEILGRIQNVKNLARSKTVTIGRFDYEAYINQPGEPLYEEPSITFHPQITLKFSDVITDCIIENARPNLICRFFIENGIVIAVEPFKTLEEIIQDYWDKWKQERSEIQDKIETILRHIRFLEKAKGCVSTSLVVDACRIEEGMDEDETRKLINRLLGMGKIYEIRKGILKSTKPAARGREL